VTLTLYKRWSRSKDLIWTYNQKTLYIFTVTLTLNTAIQYFHWSLWLTMIYHHSFRRIISSEDLAEIVIFWLYNPLSDLKFEDVTTIFSHDTPTHDDASPYQVCLQKVLDQVGHMERDRWTWWFHGVEVVIRNGEGRNQNCRSRQIIQNYTSYSDLLLVDWS